MHKRTNDFLRAIIQNVPDVPDSVMQWWAGHSPELQKVLLPLLTIPMPTVVGTYFPNLGTICDIKMDLKGNAWVTLYKNWKVAKITPDGVITTIDIDSAGRRSGGPSVLDVAPDGSIWVGVDSNPGEVFQVNPETGAVVWRQVLGRGVSHLKVDQATGDVWTCHAVDNNVRRVRPNQDAQSYPTGAQPIQIAIEKNGTIWVANQGSDNLTRITQANKSTGQSETVALSGHQYAHAVVVDALGNVCCSEVGGVTRIDAAGNTKWHDLSSSYGYPAVAVDSKNNFWVAAGDTGKAYKIDPSGTLGSPIAIGVAGQIECKFDVDSDDYVWIAFYDGAGRRGVGRISPAGVFEGPFVGGIYQFIASKKDRVWVVNAADQIYSVVQLTR